MAKKIIGKIVGFGLFIFLLVLVPFLIFVAYPVGFKPSDSSAQWGQVGDYFGGLLNPVFAFLSFLAVLYTLHKQSVGKIQDDFLRIATAASEKLDDKLSVRPDASNRVRDLSPYFNDDVTKHTVGDLYLLMLTIRTRNGLSTIGVMKSVVDLTLAESLPIVHELNNLSGALLLFKKNGGDAQVVDYFVERFRDYYIAMVYLGVVRPRGKLHEFYTPNVCWLPPGMYGSAPEIYQSKK